MKKLTSSELKEIGREPKKKLTAAQLKKVGKEAVRLLDQNTEYTFDHIWYILDDLVRRLRKEEQNKKENSGEMPV